MGDRKVKERADGEARVAVVAAAFVTKAYVALAADASAPEAVGHADSVRALLGAAETVRESLRLFGRLYPSPSKRRWARRFRGLVLDLRAVSDSDLVIEEFRGAKRSAGAGGPRAVAFLIGHQMVVRDLQAAMTARRFKRVDLVARERSFERFAADHRGGSASKQRLSAFAAVALADRVDRVVTALAASGGDDPKSLRSLRVACRKALVALDAFAGCFEPAALEAARVPMVRVFDALSRLRSIDRALEAVQEPAMAARACSGGVTALDLDELASALERRRERARAEAAAAMNSMSGTELRALVLGPVVPGFVTPVVEMAKPETGSASAASAKAVPTGAEPVNTPGRRSRAVATKPSVSRSSGARKAAAPAVKPNSAAKTEVPAKPKVPVRSEVPAKPEVPARSEAPAKPAPPAKRAPAAGARPRRTAARTPKPEAPKP